MDGLVNLLVIDLNCPYLSGWTLWPLGLLLTIAFFYNKIQSHIIFEKIIRLPGIWCKIIKEIYILQMGLFSEKTNTWVRFDIFAWCISNSTCVCTWMIIVCMHLRWSAPFWFCSHVMQIETWSSLFIFKE